MERLKASVPTIVGALALAGILAAGIYFIPSSAPAEASVDMRGQAEVFIVLNEEGFSPRNVRVSPGTRVTFTTTRDFQFWPASNPHPAHSQYDQFDPGRPLESDESWGFVIERPGVWGFHDHIRSYYVGIVYVDAAQISGVPVRR